MTLPRDVQPEWLDSLPPAAPEAQASRRDLRRLNRVMRHPFLVAREIARCVVSTQPLRLIDIGAGDGAFLIEVGRSLRWPGRVTAVLVDQAPLLSPETTAHFQQLHWDVEWMRADIGDALARLRNQPPADVMISNLFLHHFGDAALGRLLQSAAECCRTFIACEPRRCRFSLAGAALVGVLGCNSVTRHDARVSVRAGFSGRELSRLWPSGWSVAEGRAALFSHLFCARQPREPASGGVGSAFERERIP